MVLGASPIETRWSPHWFTRGRARAEGAGCPGAPRGPAAPRPRHATQPRVSCFRESDYSSLLLRKSSLTPKESSSRSFIYIRPTSSSTHSTRQQRLPQRREAYENIASSESLGISCHRKEAPRPQTHIDIHGLLTSAVLCPAAGGSAVRAAPAANAPGEQYFGGAKGTRVTMREGAG